MKEEKKVKLTSFEELKDKYLGRPGTPERDSHEKEVLNEITNNLMNKYSEVWENLPDTQPYIYLGYKEGKHWCREVNPYGKSPEEGWWPNNGLYGTFDEYKRRWQAAESQLKEYKIEELDKLYFFISRYGENAVGQQFTGEFINGKVRIL